MEIKSAVESHVEFLRKEGYVPNVNEQGMIEFRYEGMTYVIILDENDPEYFQMLLPNIFRVADGADSSVVYAAANKATSGIKVAKISIMDGGVVHAAIEMFSEDPETIHPVLFRSIRALQGIAQNFAETLRA